METQDAEGIKAISRWLSEATPPDKMRINRASRRDARILFDEVSMSTFLSLHYHIIFSTKYRKPWIGDAWIDRFHEYIGGTIRGLDGVPPGTGRNSWHVCVVWKQDCTVSGDA